MVVFNQNFGRMISPQMMTKECRGELAVANDFEPLALESPPEGN